MLACLSYRRGHSTHDSMGFYSQVSEGSWQSYMHKLSVVPVELFAAMLSDVPTSNLECADRDIDILCPRTVWWRDVQLDMNSIWVHRAKVLAQQLR